ncbi:hypothetical protein D3C86_1267010 [compost metagenome]
MGDDRNHDAGDNGNRHERRFCRHQCADEGGGLAAGRGQNENGKAAPDETHAKRDNDGGQGADMDDGAKQRINRNRTGKDRNAEQWRGLQEGGGDTGAEADEGAHRQIKIVDGHDQHLRNGGKRNRYRQIEQQVEAGIAHGARLHVEYGGEQEGERGGGNDEAKGAGGEFHA